MVLFQKSGGNDMVIFKLVKTAKGFYLYDRNRNKLARISKEEYEELEEVEKGERTIEDTESINKFREKGFLLDNVVEVIEHPELECLKHHVTHRMQQVILQVTQNCNLRCKYCVYSGGYDNRGHSNKRMSWEIAKRAIDLLMQNSDEMEQVTIGFYGGEPLLEMPLIKKCISYINETYYGKKVSYSITTNGTLLTNEIMEFLKKEPVSIIISLDGSREEHNANRVFVNGEGSYDTIMENIKRIKEKNPEFIENIHFNTVINQNNNYENIREYFSTDEIMCNSDVSLNIVELLNSKDEIVFSEEFYIGRRYDYFRYLLTLIGKISDPQVVRFWGGNTIDLERMYASMRNTNSLGKKCHHNGPCIAGARRLFVTVDGDFYPCEKVPENVQDVCLGTLDKGIDFEQVRKVMNLGEITHEQCKECWALTQCSVCAAMIAKDGKISAENKLQLCPQQRDYALENLKLICMLSEFGYKFGGKR